MFGFNSQESRTFRSLRTPAKIQDFLERIPMNFKDTCYSPRMVLRHHRAHCLEGAMLAATMLRFHGHRPLVLDLTSASGDDDHVVALFKVNGLFGAISKTNHAVLRYRDPVYKTIRELVLSYFHEYFLDDGRKTLRSYAVTDLSRFDRKGWMTSEDDVSYIERYLFRIPHTPIVTRSQVATLRCASPIERKAGKIVEWKARG
jgi:hypothetical protein